MIINQEIPLCEIENCQDEHNQQVGQRLEQLEGLFEKLDNQADRLAVDLEA